MVFFATVKTWKDKKKNTSQRRECWGLRNVIYVNSCNRSSTKLNLNIFCPDIDTRDLSLYRQANNDISVPFLNCLLTGTGIESNKYPSGRKKVHIRKKLAWKIFLLENKKISMVGWKGHTVLKEEIWILMVSLVIHLSLLTLIAFIYQTGII